MRTSAPLGHRLEGEGSPVVLLNGGMMTFGSWEPLARRFAARHQVLRFDFRGQLLSPGESPADLGGHAADVVALLDQVGWSAAHLVGTSFGALVAVELAATAPERVRSLVLVTAMDRETGPFREQREEMRRLLGDVLAGGERERFWDVLVAGVYSADYRSREAEALAARRARLSALPLAWFAGVDRLLGAVSGFDLTSRLGAIRRPALVVTAGDDRTMAPDRSSALAAALGAEVALHPTAGHALVAEDPDWLAEVALKFLARSEGSAP